MKLIKLFIFITAFAHTPLVSAGALDRFSIPGNFSNHSNSSQNSVISSFREQINELSPEELNSLRAQLITRRDQAILEGNTSDAEYYSKLIGFTNNK